MSSRKAAGSSCIRRRSSSSVITAPGSSPVRLATRNAKARSSARSATCPSRLGGAHRVPGVPRDLNALNHRARLWVDERVHDRRHRTTDVAPIERFASERGFLCRLPARWFDTDYVEARRVHRALPFIEWERVPYSVPADCLGQLVEVSKPVDSNAVERVVGRSCGPPHRIACDGPSEVWVGDPTHRVAAELSALVRTRRRHLQLIRENEPTPPAPDARIELPGGDSMSPQPTSRRAMTAAISASRVISGERRCLRTDQRRPRLPATRPSRRGVRNPRRARTAADTLVARRVSGFACSASMPTRHAVGDSPPRLRFARFPFRTTIDKFDFAFQPTVDRPFVDDLATLWFMEAGRPILFLASPAAANRTSLSRSPRSRARPGSAATHQRRREVGGEAQPPELGSHDRESR